MLLYLNVLLLAALGSIGVLSASANQSGNSQSALDTVSPTAANPSVDNLRFSRLLKNSANVLQFSSISNDAPPIWGIRRGEGKKSEKATGNAISSAASFGRRALDYDEPNHGPVLESTSETKIVAHPYPGNEYVYVRAGKLDQQVEAATNPHHREDHHDANVAASVTTINNKPPRVPLAILRQKKGKRVNITPLFTELPPQLHQDASLSTENAKAKDFVWVDQPIGEHLHRVVAVNRKGRKHEEVSEETTTASHSLNEDVTVEATTLLPENVSFESSTSKQHNSKLIVNIVTSEPRVSVESSSSEKKARYHSRRPKSTTTTTSTTTEGTTTSSTTFSTTTSAETTTTTESAPQTTTVTVSSTSSSEVPTTTFIAPILTSSSSAPTTKSVVPDVKENLVADASHRAGNNFHGFHDDSQTKLQAAESSQPARVNVRPAQNGKEYEYEYIYYYYDDDNDENGEKSGEKSAEQGKTKQTSAASPAVSTSTTTLTTPSSSAPSTSSSSSSSASSALTSASTSGSTTAAVATSSRSPVTTSTLPPHLISDADFEYEEEEVSEEDPADIRGHHVVVSSTPELQKSTPHIAVRTTEAPIHKGISSAEKLSNSNPINQLDRSRGPKLVPGKFEEALAEYKLETEASQEDAVIQTQILSRGQPVRQPAGTKSSEELNTAEIVTEDEEDDAAPVPVVHVAIREPSTQSAPLSTQTGFDIPEHMSTLAKNHRDSVNVPIVLKQSSILKAVPASHLEGQLPAKQPSTASYTTPSTTTVTVEITSDAAPSRPGSPRIRGHRLRGSAVTPRPSTTSTSGAAPELSTVAVEERPQQSLRRPHHGRDPSRRIPGRRPVHQEASTVENVPEPASSPIIEHHARPIPVRPRFPPRTGAGHHTTTVTTLVDTGVSDSPPQQVVTVSAAELNSLEDKKTKDAHVRAKSANDLFAFARLQQAISSRAPSRIPPKLVAGFVNSGEATTDSVTSSEYTTVSSYGGQSSESVSVSSSDEPSSTVTTTTTTTEAVQLDKFGRPKGRFGGRNRRPLGGGAASGSTTTTEAPTTHRARFTGGRRRPSTTEATEGAAQQSTASVSQEKPRLPQRNRFATRHRGSTTEATPVDAPKTSESEKPAVPRRRPGAGGFAGRRRPNQIGASTEASTAQTDETAASTATEAGSTASTATTAAPASALPGRNRFNFAAGGARPRPGGGAAAGANPVRIRGGGRLRGPTSTTTEAAPEEQPAAVLEETDPEQSQTIQNENLEQPIQSSPAPESHPVPQRGGVLGRLKNRPKLVVTTAPPAELNGDKKSARLNGLLGRRKNIGQLASPVHIKEEVKVVTTDGGEEANNHALEQTDDEHKGVIVQVSSSITESEEVNDAHAGEVLEPSSTTPGSILNRLKSQRKPGSLFRKKPDPHGE